MAGGPYIEAPQDVFNYDTDWLEVAPDNGSSSGNFTLETQGYTLQGYVPWNKRRSAMRYFLGFAYTDYAAPWLLHRENPSPHPDFPWLFADSFHPVGFVVGANASNPLGNPFDYSYFWNTPDKLRSTRYQVALCTVGYKALKYRTLPDSQITDPSFEWCRNCFIGSKAKLDILSADGVGQLIFAEGNAGPGPVNPGPGPIAGKTPFPAPIPVRLPKGDYVIEWYSLPFDYLSSDPDVFTPDKIIACMGCVNSLDFVVGDAKAVFPTGTALCKGYSYDVFPWPVAAANPGEVLLGVNIKIEIERFDPPLGATSPIVRGHNDMPWRGQTGDTSGGKSFLATRGGLTTDPRLLPDIDFNSMFSNVNS